MNYIKVKGLSKSYSDINALKNLSMEIEAGTLFGILGPNGAGKSTLIKILATLIEPDSGEVFINNINLIKNSRRIRELIGYVAQDIALDKIFMKRGFLNYIIFSGILFTNIIIPNNSIALTQKNIDIPKVVSYRSASCGCCKKWINHLRDNGLEVVDNIVENVSVIKNQYQIPNNLRSCHSAQIANYTIEGHVPIESINKLLREKPNINGIAVPGMPHGSPGMEMHSHDSHSHHYENYKVVSFSKTGKTKIFDKISH